MREGRRPNELRPLEIEIDYLEQPHGAVLWSQGKTKVLCTASINEGVPRWLRNSGRGWMTAEYSLLPASTGDRVEREARKGRQGGRTIEIQRLIGRAIRAVTDYDALGERTIYLDCDVLQADGGTRCAAICGAYVAARRALERFGLGKALTGSVAAISVGIVDGAPLLDLDYTEDSTADVDMNVVMTGDGRLVEVQATAEREPFTRELLDDDCSTSPATASTRSSRRSARLWRRPLLSAVPTLGWDENLFRLTLAAVLGGAIGFERELREREAGLRTHLLVCLGSALFTIISAYGFEDFLNSGDQVIRADPTRIAAQIVTGIGFLGAGAIIRQGISVRGLTTAATLWVAAAIGMAAGAGYYPGAVLGTVITLVALWPLRIAAYPVFERFRPDERSLVVDLRPETSLTKLLDALERENARIEHFQLEDENDRRVVTLTVDTASDKLLAKLGDLDFVQGVQWGG